MIRPATPLELSALRLTNPPSAGSGPLGMATLLSPTFAITASHVVSELKREVLLHFDCWPEPFTMLAQAAAVDPEADLTLLKLAFDLPADDVLPINLGTPRGIGEKWESILLNAEGLRLDVNGKIGSNAGSTILSLSTTDLPPDISLSGAPVFVGDDLLGIVQASRKGPMGSRLQVISAEAIQKSEAMKLLQPKGARQNVSADQNLPDSRFTVSDAAAVDLGKLFRRLSRASIRALSHAEGLERKMGRKKVHTEHLIAGLYEKEDGPLRILMQSAQLSGDSLQQILDEQARKPLPRLNEYEPVPLHALPPLSDHVRDALIAAQKAADEDASDTINSWHLLYGALAVEDCDLAMVLREKGLVKEKVRRGRAERTAGTTRPNIAGFISDDPRKGTDHFDITREVKALCSVLAAKSVDPPLSLGLFGDWGSGKSFFMGQMEEEFKRLKKLARADKSSPYCPNIVQLWFNAWHYMDMNLWASLASEIFEGLAQELAKDENLDVGQTDPETARERLLAATASRKDVLADAERRKTVAETQLHESEARLARLKDADQELTDSLSWQALSHAAYSFVASQPNVRANIEEAGKALNLSAAEVAATETKGRLLELKGLWGRAKALYVSIINAKSYTVWLALLVCVALVLIAIPVLLQYKEHLVGWLGGISVFLVGVGGLAKALKPYLAGVGRAFKIIEDARSKNQALIEQRRAEAQRQLETQRTQLQAQLSDATVRVQEANAEVRQLEQRLDELRADRQMANFIRQRYESHDYTSQLGTIARARNDFEHLSDLLAKVKAQTAAEAERAARVKEGQAAAESSIPDEETLLLPRIDRIVLYIDDLDRCPEDKVVDVLQAVHLLLAFPLFVVIVGVDPRWLLHSLKQHAKVFQGKAENGNDGIDEEMRHWQSTPLNYLEKIFQIPFTLRPMALTGFGDFIEDLARTPDTTAGQSAGHEGSAAPAPPTTATDAEAEAKQPAIVIPSSAGAASQTTPASPTVEAQRVAPEGAGLVDGRETTIEAAAKPATEPTVVEVPPAVVEVPPESNPEHLRIEDWERECMKQLFWLIPSPRAAKRFVNIYRLLRATVPEEQRDSFVGDATQGTYRVALVLLAILTGYPSEAADILRDLLTLKEERTWWQFIDGFETRVFSTSKAPRNGSGQSEAETENLRQLFRNLKQVRSVIPDNQSCADFIDWAPKVARYSFQSGRVLLATRDQEPEEDD